MLPSVCVFARENAAVKVHGEVLGHPSIHPGGNSSDCSFKIVICGQQ